MGRGTVLGIILTLSLVLVGCGGSSREATGDGGSEASPPAPTPTARATLDGAASTPTQAAAPASDGGFLSGDENALVALYNATDGDDWSDNTNWLSAAPLDEWYGVTTDATGRVIELVLEYNDLDGWIPSELGRLSRLERLSLHGNRQLGEELPPELGNLSRLERLSLHGNRQLGGEIPPELGNLSNLTILSLSLNELSGCIPAVLEGALYKGLDRPAEPPLCQ